MNAQLLSTLAASGTGPLFLLSEEGGFNPLQVGDWTLYFWTAVIFVLLFGLLWWKVWGPLMKTVNQREARIRGDLDKAEAARVEAEKAREAHQRELEKAAQGAKALLDEADRRAAKLKTELEAQARAQAESIVQKARQQIEAEKLQALQEIRDHVIDLSVEITRRVVAKGPEREEYLKEAEALMPKLRGLS